MLPSLVLTDVGLNNPLKPSITTRTFNLWGYDVTTKKGLRFTCFLLSVIPLAILKLYLLQILISLDPVKSKPYILNFKIKDKKELPILSFSACYLQLMNVLDLTKNETPRALAINVKPYKL